MGLLYRFWRHIKQNYVHKLVVWSRVVVLTLLFSNICRRPAWPEHTGEIRVVLHNVLLLLFAFISEHYTHFMLSFIYLLVYVS